MDVPSAFNLAADIVQFGASNITATSQIPDVSAPDDGRIFIALGSLPPLSTIICNRTDLLSTLISVKGLH